MNAAQHIEAVEAAKVALNSPLPTPAEVKALFGEWRVRMKPSATRVTVAHFTTVDAPSLRIISVKHKTLTNKKFERRLGDRAADYPVEMDPLELHEKLKAAGINFMVVFGSPIGDYGVEILPRDLKRFRI